MEKKENKKAKKIKKLEVEIRFSDEPCTREESIKAIAELCFMMLEGDRDYHRKKLQEGSQYCDYCKKEITELNDFCSPDDRNCCLACGKKLLEDPNRPRTFCGFPVRE